MSSWTKGPLCGKDNCTSRLWHVVEGYRVCRNGHVREGDIEIGSDDDEFYSQRTLRIPSQPSQHNLNNSEHREILSGSKATKLYMQSLQYLLRNQVNWLINQKFVPPELEVVVRSLWAIYVNITEYAREDVRSSRATSVTVDNEEPISNMTYYPSGNKNRPYFAAEYLHTISLCYLGCVYLRIPIYLYDLHRWTCRCEFPYIGGMYLLSEGHRKQLSFVHQRLLLPDIPTMSMVQEATQLMVWYFNGTMSIEFPVPRIEPLAIKILRDFLLPPEMYPAVVRLAGQVGIDLKTDPKREISAQKFGELALVAVVIVCIKLWFGLDGIIRIPDNDWEPASHKVNWQVWLDLLRKFWLQEEIYPVMDERDICFWSQGRIDRYLDWFHDKLEKSTDLAGVKESRAKMYNMFPIGVYDENGAVVEETESFLSDSVEKEKCLNDMIRFMQTTTETFEFQRDLEVIKRSGGVILTPGARYPMFTELGEMPDFLDIVNEVGAKICGLKASSIRKYVRRIEEKLR